MVEYNLLHEKGINKFKWYEGKNAEQMPNLVVEGRASMNTSQLMQRRLEVRDGPKGVKTAWMNNYFNVGDAVVYHPETKDSLIDLDSEILKGISLNPKKLNGGAWLLSENKNRAFEIYEQIKNKTTSVLIEDKYLKKTNLPLTEQEALDSKWWRVLLRHPNEVPEKLAVPGLHEETTHYIFTEGKEKYKTAMGIYPGSCGGDKPEMRAWCVARFITRSLVNGRNYLDYDHGRLVGIVP